MIKKLLVASVASLLVLTAPTTEAAARKTTYPVVFAHGMAGYDNLLGAAYWGDDYGTFVGDPCDEWFEVYCNGDLNSSQKATQTQVAAFQNSEVRGLDLANDVENYMASSGAYKVNLVGHSQGGIDARKAATLLQARKGRQVVQALISISSPHRGSPLATYVYNLGPGVTSVVNTFATMFGNSIYDQGNDGYQTLNALTYNDLNPNDGVITGAKVYNQNYNVGGAAAYWGSFITAQNGLDVNPALYIASQFFYNVDGDGYCVDDCDGDGAAGMGDGNASNLDDDGAVGINSQQMGWRLQMNSCFLCLDYVSVNSSTGYVSDMNNPNATQMTSKQSLVNQDHLDVTGLGPDMFDEMEFYAGVVDFIAQQGG